MWGKRSGRNRAVRAPQRFFRAAGPKICRVRKSPKPPRIDPGDAGGAREGLFGLEGLHASCEHRPSSPSLNQPTPAEHQARRQSVTASNVADRHTGLHGLGNDGQLQLSQEAAPGDVGDHGDGWWNRSRPKFRQQWRVRLAPGRPVLSAHALQHLMNASCGRAPTECTLVLGHRDRLSCARVPRCAGDLLATLPASARRSRRATRLSDGMAGLLPSARAIATRYFMSRDQARRSYSPTPHPW